MFMHRGQLSGISGACVEWAFTDRDGGLSRGALGSLNLGGAVGDDPEVVAQNRQRVADAFQVDSIAFMQQCHGVAVARVDSVAGPAQPADGMYADQADLALGVLVADCTPVLLADPDAGLVAAVHAGRPGMTGGIINVAVDALIGAGATQLHAIVGPSVCGRCYEVPAAMQRDAARIAPASRAMSWTGTPAIDVAAGVVEQLHAREVAVTWLPGCTREAPELFSYRADKGAGRQCGVIVHRRTP